MNAVNWPKLEVERVDRGALTSESRLGEIASMRQKLMAGDKPGVILAFKGGKTMPATLVREFRKDRRWAYNSRLGAFVALGHEVKPPASGTPQAGSWMRINRDSRKKGFLCLHHFGIGSRIIVRMPDEVSGARTGTVCRK